MVPTDAKAEYTLKHGYDDVFRTETLAEDVRRATGGRGVDLIRDPGMAKRCGAAWTNWPPQGAWRPSAMRAAPIPAGPDSLNSTQRVAPSGASPCRRSRRAHPALRAN
ncbi:hypothetical protein [Streptomyces angustmyceticus]|uniref:hypothetical protein n=1 Tax=Streptomyces angustmyceticus TaxID=285578 RepID=UPI0035A24717